MAATPRPPQPKATTPPPCPTPWCSQRTCAECGHPPWPPTSRTIEDPEKIPPSPLTQCQGRQRGDSGLSPSELRGGRLQDGTELKKGALSISLESPGQTPGHLKPATDLHEHTRSQSWTAAWKTSQALQAASELHKELTEWHSKGPNPDCHWTCNPQKSARLCVATLD